MRLKLMMAAALAVTTLQAGAESAWVLVAETNEIIVEAKKGTGEWARTDSGKAVYVATTRMRSKTGNEPTKFFRSYVDGVGCAREQGQIVFLQLDGEYAFASDFVFSGNTPSSALAELLCAAAVAQAKKQGTTTTKKNPAAAGAI